jgi:hypothetical protein
MKRIVAISAVLIAGLPLFGQMQSIPMQLPVPATYTPTKLDLYTAYCGLWRTDASYQSTIRLSNQLSISPIDATVTLYRTDGTPYQLPIVHLTRSGVKTVNVNQALATMPDSVAAHLSSYGSASVSYRYDWQGTVLSTMSILDVVRSLEYDYHFQFPASPSSPPSTTNVEGPIWSYSQQTEVFLSLANTSGQPANVSLSILDANGNAQSTQQLVVAPKNTLMQHLLPPATGNGGIRVVSNAPPDALLLSAGLEDVAHGYSAQLPLASLPDAASQPSDNSAASVGLMVGAQDPMMGFPSGIRFTPYAYLRNNGTTPVQLYTQAMYMQGGRAQSLALPSIVINPHQTKQLDVSGAIQRLGLNGEMTLVFSYHGQPDALLTTTGSINESGSYVFAVEPRAVGGQCNGKSSTYWRTDGGFDTMYSIWNSKAEPEDLVINFQYGDAQSYLYPVHLDANGMAMLDIKEIVAKAQPDANGHLLPQDATEGSLVIENVAGHKVPMSIVMSGGIYNPLKATCGPITETCNGCTTYWAAANPFGTAIGLPPTQMASGCTMYNGVNDGYTGNWSSGSPAIISISTGGSATPVGAGSTPACGCNVKLAS